MTYPKTITIYTKRPWYRRIISRQKAKRILFYQLIVLSLLMNLWFCRSFYVVRCQAGGWFMSKEQCGDIAQSKQDSQFYASEFARLESQVEEMRTNQLNQ